MRETAKKIYSFMCSKTEYYKTIDGFSVVNRGFDTPSWRVETGGIEIFLPNNVDGIERILNKIGKI